MASGARRPAESTPWPRPVMRIRRSPVAQVGVDEPVPGGHRGAIVEKGGVPDDHGRRTLVAYDDLERAVGLSAEQGGHGSQVGVRGHGLSRRLTRSRAYRGPAPCSSCLTKAYTSCPARAAVA